jgi:hypothetical protein
MIKSLIPLFRLKVLVKNLTSHYPRPLFYLTLGIVLFASCKKEEEAISLPPITSNGANTFGAIVNGEIISLKGKENFSGGLYADPQEDSCGNCWLPPDSSDIYLRIKKDGRNAIFIYLTDPRHTPEWRLNRPSRGFWEIGYHELKAYVEYEGFRTGITTDGFIRSDFSTRGDFILSAQFEFKCINPKTCQEFSIKDGRIDVNLNSISHFP